MKNLGLASIYFFFFLLNFSAKAQQGEEEIVASIYEKIATGNFSAAENLAQESVTHNPNSSTALALLANIQLEQKKYPAAITNYQKISLEDTVIYKNIFLNYAQAFAGMGNFLKAVNIICQTLSTLALSATHKNLAEEKLNQYQFGVEMQKKMGLKIASMPASIAINTDKHSYYPYIEIRDSIFYFTQRQEGWTEALFQSKMINKDSFGVPKKVFFEPNFLQSLGGITLSADGATMVLAGITNDEGSAQGNFDLYISHKKNNEWTKPKNLGYAINTEFWESSPALSADQKYLYFSSNRPGGYGGKDIYVAQLLDNGAYGMPRNLGRAINTAHDEFAPFLALDNQSFYFTSDGWQGYGGQDIFYTQKINDTLWEKPENIGYPINTIANEGSMFINAFDHQAYFTSDREIAAQKLNIYVYALPSFAAPLAVVPYDGKVFNQETLAPIQNVRIEVMTKNSLLSETFSTKEGSFFFYLPKDSSLQIQFFKVGYFFKTLFSKHLKDSLLLTPLKKGKSFNLYRVYFKTNEAILDSTDLKELNNLVYLLNLNPTLKLRIIGHTDSVGIAQANYNLSVNRAFAVMNFLLAHHIPHNRLSYQGKGAAQPLSSNKTLEGRALNRRTELLIIEE